MPTVRAVDPFGQVFRPTGVELPGWAFALFAVGLSGIIKCVGLTLSLSSGWDYRMSPQGASIFLFIDYISTWHAICFFPWQ